MTTAERKYYEEKWKKEKKESKKIKESKEKKTKSISLNTYHLESWAHNFGGM